MQEVVQRVMDQRASHTHRSGPGVDLHRHGTQVRDHGTRGAQGGRDVTLRLLPAVASYALMVVGLQVFVLSRLHRSRRVARGALFGAIVYGLYNGTCMSILADWSPIVAALDTAWGAAVFAIAARVS